MGTRVQGSGKKQFQGTSGNAAASHAMASNVSAGNALIARIAAFRFSDAAGELIDAVTDDKGNTWVKVASLVESSGATGHRTGVYIYAAYNVAAGATTVSIDLTDEDGSTYVSWDVDEWSGLATAAAADKTATGSVDSESASSVSTASTGTLAQASEVAIGIVAGPYPYSWNDVGGSGSPPSGWTLINGDTTQVAGGALSYQTIYRQLAATTAISATWTIPASSGSKNIAVLATFKDASATTLVAECDVDDDIATESPTEVYVHAGGRPDQVLATRYTGAAITVVGSAGSRKIRVTPAPAGTTAGQSVTFSGFGSTYDMGYYTGTVVAV